MMKAYRRNAIALAWGLALWGVAGCNLIFGIEGGAGGACAPYDGDGVTSWQPVGSANIATLSFSNGGSITATYDKTTNITDIRLDSMPSGYCRAEAHLHIAGLPVAGKQYKVVDKAAYDATIPFSKDPNVYIFAGAAKQPDGGDCATTPVGAFFGSIAGSGEVTIDSVSGTRVDFTVSSVQLTGLVDAALMSDGQGTIQLDIKAHADCLTMQ